MEAQDIISNSSQSVFQKWENILISCYLLFWFY